jgi:malate dehydrogenase (oxaloacetate-decarboxylating)
LLSNGLAHEFPARVALELERDAFLVNRHAGLQTFPLWVRSRHDEEFIKTAIALAPNFFALRISSFARDDALDILERLEAECDQPIILAEYLESAGLITAILKNAARLHGIQLEGATAGIIGLGPAGHGIARLLERLGVKRIFGIDHDSRQLSRFEKGPGIASSLDHVYDNADFIIISPDYPTRLHEERLHEKQLVLSFTPGALDIEAAEKNGAFVFQGFPPHPVFILPGLLGAIHHNRLKRVEPEHILKLVETLAVRSGEGQFLPAPSTELFRSQINSLSR